MFRQLGCILWLFLAVGCTSGGGDLKLPRNDNDGPTEVKNISQAYIFLRTEKGDTTADLHMGQLVTASHWAVHVDRRLPLKKLIVPLEKLLKKRHKKSIHSMPGARAYFTYIDTVENKMRLVDFENLKIVSPFPLSSRYVGQYPKSYPEGEVWHVFYSQGQLRVNGQAFPYPSGKKQVADLLQKAAGEKVKKLLLNVDYNTDFNVYADVYSFLKRVDTLHWRMDGRQFWFDPEEVKYD